MLMNNEYLLHCKSIKELNYDLSYLFLIMQQDQYVKYLQSILRNHNIPFYEEQLYHQQQNQQHLQVEKKAVSHQITAPLQTNLIHPLTGSLIQRYSRQMLLKQIAYEGQNKIIQAKVAIIGAGGIGCPLALYLSAAGIGTIGLFDSDKVDVTNLHRQIGHKTETVGISKTLSLKNTLLSLNPNIKVNEHPFITAANANLLNEYDIVVDGSDNPTCRYIVNDQCMKTNKKLLSGACIGWEAQITCYGGNGPCYRCLWGNDQINLGGCSTLGVVGMLPGLVGIILATETLKMILNKESSLDGKLLTYEGRKCEFKKIQLRKKQPDCIGCGINKLDMSTYNYAKYGLCSSTAVPEVPEITWQQFIEKYGENQTLLDVRPNNHYSIVHFKKSINIPFERLNKMPKQQIIQALETSEETILLQPVPVNCKKGVMSKHAAQYLTTIGLKAVSIKGGIQGYKILYDSQIPEL